MNPWITPKTNWRVRIDPWTGNYLGDFFNVADYERIVGNIKYLHDIARRASPDDVTIKPLAPMHWGVPITEKNNQCHRAGFISAGADVRVAASHHVLAWERQGAHLPGLQPYRRTLPGPLRDLRRCAKT